MSKTQLKPSPLEVFTQEFLDVSVHAVLRDEHGPGTIKVDREVARDGEYPDCWIVSLVVEIEAVPDEQPPPYTGSLRLRGVYKVSEGYKHDAEHLIRVTGASMLYGAARELFAQITARGPNGLLTLPSVSFFEGLPAKEIARKKGAKKSASNRRPAKERPSK